MERQIKLFIFFFIFFFIQNAKAQIILEGEDDNPFPKNTLATEISKDSIETIYGSFTTKYIHERDLYRMSDTLYTVDTTLYYFYKYNYNAKSGYIKQNLANLGTPAKDIYISPPENIGIRLGLYTLDQHIINSYDEAKYYNSKSPYTDWYYVDGGEDRSVINVILSQNIKPHWSATLGYKNIRSNTLIGNKVKSRNDINVNNQQFLFNTWYETPKGRYKFMANYTNTIYKVYESGGIILDTLNINGTVEKHPIDFFLTVDDGLLNNRFSEIETRYTCIQFNFYHQFNLFKKSRILQFFHRFSRKNQEYVYQDNNFNENKSNYQNLFLNEINFTAERIKFQQLNSRFGLKGKVGPLFYGAYIQFSNYKKYHQFDQGNSLPFLINPQNLLNFQSYYTIGDLSEAGISYTQIVDRKNFDLKFYFKNKYTKLSYRFVVYQPNQIQMHYFGNFFQWNNKNFVDMSASKIDIETNITIKKKYQLKPYFSFTQFDRYTYFDTLANPKQAFKIQTMLYGGIYLIMKKGIFNQEINIRYSNVSELLRVPTWLIVYQNYFNISIKNDKIKIQPGLDIRYQSAYLAENYEPVTKQFFLQNKYKIGNYPVADIFLNFKINETKFFLKVTNIVYKLKFLGSHYFVTPGYMGQARTFEFGLDWKLFD